MQLADEEINLNKCWIKNCANSDINVCSVNFINTMNCTSQSKHQRSEKKPIPDNQKDEKYYERRKRNNQAAKKSRDARKVREDIVSIIKQ